MTSAMLIYAVAKAVKNVNIMLTLSGSIISAGVCYQRDNLHDVKLP